MAKIPSTYKSRRNTPPEEIERVHAHSQLLSIFPAMKHMEHLDALEVQLERDRYWPKVLRHFKANVVLVGISQQTIREDYNDITNRIIRTKLAQQELKAAVRRKENDG